MIHTISKATNYCDNDDKKYCLHLGYENTQCRHYFAAQILLTSKNNDDDDNNNNNNNISDERCVQHCSDGTE